MKIERHDLYVAAAKCGLPAYMQEGLVEYILTGRPVGNFLSAVVSNDLKEACNRADETNKHLLWEYIYFLYNHAPRGCWGSEENMTTWISHRGMEWNTGEDTDGSER